MKKLLIITLAVLATISLAAQAQTVRCFRGYNGDIICQQY